MFRHEWTMLSYRCVRCGVDFRRIRYYEDRLLTPLRCTPFVPGGV